MDARFNYHGNPVGLKFQKRLNALAGAVTDANLPAGTQSLCMIRASQINGCGVCSDMPTKDAAHAGETSVRLNLIAAWPDAKVFTDAERAALELTEQGTRHVLNEMGPRPPRSARLPAGSTCSASSAVSSGWRSARRCSPGTAVTHPAAFIGGFGPALGACAGLALLGAVAGLIIPGRRQFASVPLDSGPVRAPATERTRYEPACPT